MEKRIVVDADHKIVASWHEVFTLVDENGQAVDKPAVRCLEIESIDGEKPIEWAIERACEQYSQNTGDAEVFYWRLISLVLFRFASGEMDVRRTRSFRITSLDRERSLQDLAEYAGMARRPRVERLLRFGGETSAPTEKLLREAVFQRPSFGLRLSAKDYGLLRDELLSRLYENSLDHIEQCWEADGTSEEIRCQKAVANNRPKDREKTDGTGSSVAKNPCDVFLRLNRQILAEAEDAERKRAAFFVEDSRRACSMREPLLDAMRGKKSPGLDIDQSVITETVDIEAAREFLRRVLKHYEEFYGISPATAAWTRNAVTGQTPGRPGNDVTFPSEESLWREYVGLVIGVYDEGPEAVFLGLMVAADGLSDRSEYLRKMQREADCVFQILRYYVYRIAYDRLRSQLGRAERRLYRLLHFPRCVFNYEIAATNPTIMSFWYGMDNTTQNLIVSVLVFGIKRVPDFLDARDELARRWRAYLRFYPYWCDMVQNDERERKRTARQWKRGRELSLSMTVGKEEDGRETKLSDRIAARNDNLNDLLTFWIGVSVESMRLWPEQYCTPKQAAHVIARFLENKSESEIAKEHGISQQAVSKSIMAGLERIRKGLRADGIL